MSEFEKLINNLKPAQVLPTVIQVLLLEGGFEFAVEKETRRVALSFFPVNMPFMKFTVPLPSLAFIQFANEIDKVKRILNAEETNTAA